MNCSKVCFTVALTLAVFGTGRAANAIIISTGSDATLRYGYHTGSGGGLDADTLHYWNFDSGAVPYTDTGVSATPINMTAKSGTIASDSVLFSLGGATNSMVRIGTTGTGSNRVTAFTAATNTTDNITADQANLLYGSNGAITIDMLLRPDFDSTLPVLGSTMRLINEENDTTEVRPQNLFLGYNNQSDVLPSGAHVIDFHMGGTQVQAVVPFTGPDALAAGSWYHLAVIYTGDEAATNNVKFYWTKVGGVSDATTAAHLLSTATISADPAVLTLGPEFTFGNETNGSSSKSWFGALDEIRFSGVDRDPTGTGAGFIFGLQGDYNGDRVVDAADYVLWQKDPAAHFGDDGYTQWRANFAAPSSGGGAALPSAASLSAVPEPVSSALIVMAFIAIGVPPMVRCRTRT